MKPFLTIFALLFTMSTHAAVTITNAEFVLTLGGDWVRVPSSDTNQFSFESKSNKTSVVLSLTSLSISQDKLVEVAKKFGEIRQKAEQDARPGQKLQFGDKWAELRPSKDVAEVAYAGYDSKSIFRFFGFVTQRKVLSIWVSTETRDNELSKRVFDEVYRGLKFYVP
ncbi:MAG: hypothetical protein K8R23_09500 [Chthoniobacter sp.]|nr:hypothetical protein [Chthoniobacter sp.]